MFQKIKGKRHLPHSGRAVSLVLAMKEPKDGAVSTRIATIR
ncbi:unnamed protein product [Strongylus vulgaris]|uniref:Uncharacterized protein n=1 Tax=Strongylus vulgaris TaxID=40348 RepID=A0A3P7L304_STRVU|nr:unnamed protein product [Strongylus vulgaris]